MYCPCLSAVVAVQPLSPATRHRLGGLLSHQLADRTQAPLSAGREALYSYETMENYPAFRQAMLHPEVDSYALLTRLPVTSYCYKVPLTCMLKARRQRSS